MKNTYKIPVIIILTIIGCQSNRLYVPDFSENVDYSCREIKYMGLTDSSENIISYKYYNEKEQLIEQIGHEYRIKYNYDNQGKLLESYSCRMYNCEIGWREILFYDNLGNHIGSFLTLDTIVDLDTVKFEQIRYYNSDNHLVKELSDKGTDINGKKYEYWKSYTYKNGLIITEIETSQDENSWIGTYLYDDNENLLAINRIQDNLFENELFEYNTNNHLNKKIIESNKYPLSENTSFSVNNNTTTYLYDNQNRLIEEITYNHKGEKYRTFLYRYDCKE